MENNGASKPTEPKGQKAQGNFPNNGNRNSSGGNRGGNSNNNGGKQYNKGHNPGKAGKPERQIYRPPSMRSKNGRNGTASGNNEVTPADVQQTCNKSELTKAENANVGSNTPSNKVPGNNFHPPANNNNGNMYPPSQQNGGSVPNSPLITRHVFNFNASPNQQSGRSLNANAKEFQFVPNQQQQLQTQQLANLFSQLNPRFYSDAAGALLASYSLQQSKSLGNNMNLFVHGNQNSMALPYNLNVQNPLGFNGYNGGHQVQSQKPSFMTERQGQDPQQGKFVGLTQSKSSGSIPGLLPASQNKPRVRFDDEDSEEEANRNTMKNAESVFASMKLNSEAFMKNPQEGLKHPVISPVPKPLQKSRTGFLLNLYSPQSPSSPPTQQPVSTPSFPQQAQGILKQTPAQQIPEVKDKSMQQSTVKRSRSFGSTSHSQRSASLVPIHSVYSDFQINKWPKRVQETITAAVTAVERVAARFQIEMVTLIFEAMLNSSSSNSSNTEDIGKATEANWRSHETDEDSSDLTTAAVHIFIYFIQREKDRTVMESLLNTGFATFQKLFGSGQPNKSTDIIASQCGIFLKFISSLYSQVKLIQRQNSKQQGQQTMDEMSFTLLALLCDSCLATLRSRLCNDPSLMGCLFTVMTSQGRDMEGTFPLKMKQLLAAVRDALLGLGPYSKGPLSAMVQKTLMQLIELHAANWQLPASAVRYYYTNNSNSSGGNKNSSGGMGST